MIERPIIPIRHHPIYTGKYNIQTKSIDELCNEVVKWIDNRNPGGIIYGRARIGKTRAIHNLVIALKEIYGDNLPVFVLNMSDHKPSEKYFYLELLSDLNHSIIKPSRTVIELKTTAINHMITFGKSYETNRIILIIDEANFLNGNDYNCLIDVYNRLELSGVQLTVLLVGTKDILSTKSMLIQTHKQQIIGRFMVRVYRFNSVKNIQDLQICLASYDYSEYPIESGWSFTRYFFPEAFDEGHKIYQLAEVLFDCFKDLYKSKKPIEIPMQYITSTIENCFRKFGCDGLNNYFPTRNELELAIKDSGYEEAEALTEMCM